MMTYLKEFFHDVYRPGVRSKSLSEFTSYLGNDFPKLSLEEQLELEGPLTVQEGFLALSKMKNDKSPGPDGFSVNFF